MACQAAVYQCRDAQGVSIYTDQPCDAIGAAMVSRIDTKRPGGARSDAPGATLGSGGAESLQTHARLVPGCSARDPATLASELRFALESGDANRVAALYHWPGASSSSARALFSRFGRMVDRQTLGVELVYANAVTVASAQRTDTWLDDWPASSGPAAAEVERPPPAPPPRRRSGMPSIVISQQGDGDAGTTHASIRSYAGCLWFVF